MDLNAQLLAYVLAGTRWRRPALAIVRALFEGGARPRNILEALCIRNADPKASALEKLLALEIVVMRGTRRGAVYDLSRRARAAAKQLPSINPA